MSNLFFGTDGQVIQCFPLSYGFVALQAGTFPSITMIHCVADGSVSIAFSGHVDPVILALTAGEEYVFPMGTSITISTGIFHLA